MTDRQYLRISAQSLLGFAKKIKYAYKAERRMVKGLELQLVLKGSAIIRPYVRTVALSLPTEEELQARPLPVLPWLERQTEEQPGGFP